MFVGLYAGLIILAITLMSLSHMPFEFNSKKLKKLTEDNKIQEKFPGVKDRNAISAFHILVDGCSCSQSFLEEFAENYIDDDSDGFDDYFIIMSPEKSESFDKHLIKVPQSLQARALFYNKDQFKNYYDVSSAPYLVAIDNKSSEILYSGGYNTTKISNQRKTQYLDIKKSIMAGRKVEKLPGLGCHSAESTIQSAEFSASYYIRTKIKHYTGLRLD